MERIHSGRDHQNPATRQMPLLFAAEKVHLSGYGQMAASVKSFLRMEKGGAFAMKTSALDRKDKSIGVRSGKRA
jgi:hypothetical protein